ncbi:glycosyl transferase group 1 [Candidatus Magnetomorum sp. HK-1]|nr:glycosyl transferase group 1 [Candidatus Magnetomorum sp. HK-1]
MKNNTQISGNALFDQAIQWTDQGDPQKAMKCYEQLIQIQPNNATAFNNMGILFNQFSQYENASICYKQAIRIKADYSNAWFNWGNVLKNQEQYKQAIDKYTNAIKFNPNFFQAYNNLGECWAALENFDAATQSYTKAIQINPNAAGSYFNLANLFYRIHERERGIEYYKKSIACDPNFGDAHYNLSFALLLSGDYVNGFKEYEWRLNRGPFTGDCFSQPFWDGSAVPDKTVFVYSEQGFGDGIHFCRYLTIISERVGKLIFGCRKEQANLFKTIIGVDDIIIPGDKIPEFDLQCSLLSLPYLLKTDADSIPCNTPYIFPDLSKSYKKLDDVIQGKGALFRVGIVWGGNPENKNDALRSIPLKQMARLFSIPNIQWFSFQKGPQAADAKNFTQQLIDLSEFFIDFDDTAHGLYQMDLLITVDTSVAHLAGALGIPFWLLIPFQPDWRWLLDKTDNPWYPTCYIFRRDLHENWDQVLDRVEDGLKAMIFQKPHPVAKSLFDYGIQLAQQKNEAMACVAFQKALSIYPRMWEAELNLSALFAKADIFFAAVQYGLRASRRQIQSSLTWQHIGKVYHKYGDILSAIKYYKKAKEIAPDDPKINYEFSQLLLLDGQWTEGLALYEYRKFCDDLPKRRKYKLEYWDGKPFKNKTLLLYSEFQKESLIQFIRFVPLVKQYGGKVILETPPEMYRLFVDYPGIDRIFYFNDRLDSESESIFDLQASLQSLPYILSLSKEDISHQEPYIKARKEYVPLLHHISCHAKKIKVGISCFDEREKNFPFSHLFEQLSQFFQLKDVSFFQIAFRIPDYMSHDDMIDLSPFLDDYCDLAGAIANMDIIISTDNAIGHLAGAMRKPVFMILPKVPNCYWQMNSQKSAWYPTMTLFRQSSMNNWQTVLQKVLKNLVEFCSNSKQSQKEVFSLINTVSKESVLINAIGFFDGFSGYHVHTRSFFNALKTFAPVLETEMQLDSRLKNSIQYIKNEIIPSNQKIFNIAIRSIHRMDVLSGCPGTKIGYVVWESTHIPEDWLSALSCADILWTPSQWGKDVLISNGIKEEIIDVIPEGVNTKAFKINGSRLKFLDDINAFKFLHVGKFEIRKGSEELILAFDEAFKDNANVLLILCSHTYKKEFDFQNYIKSLNLKNPQKIIRVGPFAKNEDLAALYRSCNAFVMPTRAEGWGLPIIEAMACGLPTIVTGYSGLTEFATNENSYLIDYKLEEIKKPFGLQIESKSTYYGQWASPDFEHLKELMQYVFTNSDKARKLGQFAANDIHSKWTWHHAAEKAFKAIQELMNLT